MVAFAVIHIRKAKNIAARCTVYDMMESGQQDKNVTCSAAKSHQNRSLRENERPNRRHEMTDLPSDAK